MWSKLKLISSLILIVVSILGAVDASYISYEKLNQKSVICSPGLDCDTVLNSPWAQIGPIPLSVIGFFFYITVLGLAILNYLEFDLQKFYKHQYFTTDKLIMFLTSFGFLFSMYLVFLMGFVIKAWCFYCLLSALSSTTLFVIALIHQLSLKKVKNAISD